MHGLSKDSDDRMLSLLSDMMPSSDHWGVSQLVNAELILGMDIAV